MALGCAVLAAGVLAVVSGVLMGEVQVGLLLIVPYLQSSSWIGGMAMLLLFSGFLLLSLGALPRPPEGAPAEDGDRSTDDLAPRAKKEFGGVVLVGPLPIVFGSSSRAALLALALGAMALMGLMLVVLLIV